MRTHIVLVLFLILGFTVTSFGADGGTLHLSTVPWDQSNPGWKIENATLNSGRAATIALGTYGAQDVHVFEPEEGPPIRILVTNSKPHRIACDVNGNGIYEDDEIVTEHGRLESVRVPYPLRDTVPSVTAVVNVMWYFRTWELTVERITNVYQGKITLRDREYPAQLVFRSAFPTGDVVNEAIILDSNGNGSFSPADDTWFSSEGIAYLEGSLWTVQTTFHNEKADVDLAPYSGPTGRLEIDGKGIHWLSVRKETGDETAEITKKAFDIRLPGKEGSTFALPPGDYEVAKVWLKPEKSRNVYYRSTDMEKPLEATVTAGATASIPAGGPLRGKVKLGPRFLSRNVSFDYKGCGNDAGIEFESLIPTRNALVQPNEPPSFEVVDAAGQVAASGSFDYG
jgi:hypothetical protein